MFEDYTDEKLFEVRATLLNDKYEDDSEGVSDSISNEIADIEYELKQRGYEIIDERNYFDYELAYKMYNKCKELLEKGGIDELDEYFYERGDRENGYTYYYGYDYNTAVYIVNTNYGTDKEDDTWLGKCKGLEVSGEVDMISYNGGDDTLYINEKRSIEKRIDKLLDYAKTNDYTIDDYEKELKSLEWVLTQIESESE